MKYANMKTLQSVFLLSFRVNLADCYWTDITPDYNTSYPYFNTVSAANLENFLKYSEENTFNNFSFRIFIDRFAFLPNEIQYLMGIKLLFNAIDSGSEWGM